MVVCVNTTGQRSPCSRAFQVGNPLATSVPSPVGLTVAPASQELVSQFNSLLENDTYFGLLATIEAETLKPLDLLSPVAPAASFADNLSVLAPYLKPTEALYIILRRHDTAPRFVAITYVPDSAKVRQKMLFASTRLTLTRELGSEHFRETLFVTDPDELSARGFEKHDAHVKLDAPLTEEEQTLGAVKRAEQEAGSGTGVKEIHLSNHMKLPVDEAATAALKELGEGSGRVLASLVCPFLPPRCPPMIG